MFLDQVRAFSGFPGPDWASDTLPARPPSRPTKFDKFGQLWSNMHKFRQIWTNFETFRQIWTDSDKFRQNTTK